MKLDAQKELVPVIYGDSAVKVLPPEKHRKGKLCFNTHWHERMELLRVLSGSLKVRVGSEVFSAPAGSLAVIAPQRPHMGVSEADGTSYITIMFDPSTFFNATAVSERLLEPLSRREVDFDPLTDDSRAVALADALAKAQLGSTDEFGPLAAVGLVYELLSAVFRRCRRERPPLAAAETRLKSTLDFIAEHCCEDISSLSLSRRFGYDEAYFCRRFKAVTGLTPMRYIRILRLERSKPLLRNGDGVAEVAGACGFADSGYFTRCFKRHYGLTPSDYRSAHLK